MFSSKKRSIRNILIGISLIVLPTMSCKLTRDTWDLFLDAILPVARALEGTKLDIQWMYRSNKNAKNYSSYDEDDNGKASLGEYDLSATEQESMDSSDSTYGPLKPIGFVNYGVYDATVRADTFIPLGKTEYVKPPTASTVSSANDGSGTWPNTSRFISVPMGYYSWCVEWEEGDVDEDGQIDYFHYIQNDPTLLDENDSDELEFAEEVAIQAPPDAAPIYSGHCEVEDPSAEYIWVEVGAGDYIGSDVDSSEGPIPDDSKAGPGITAICWDNEEYIHFSDKAWCTYKNVDWEECLDGPYKGRMYIAVKKE